jgi:hypothetical protein
VPVKVRGTKANGSSGATSVKNRVSIAMREGWLGADGSARTSKVCGMRTKRAGAVGSTRGSVRGPNPGTVPAKN